MSYFTDIETAGEYTHSVKITDDDLSLLHDDIFKRFPRLSQLDIRSSKLTSLPSSVTSLQRLRYLKIANQEMDLNIELPKLRAIPGLALLVITETSTSLEADSLAALSALQSLQVPLKNIRDVADLERKLPQLQQLTLRGNAYDLATAITPALAKQLSRLERLNLQTDYRCRNVQWPNRLKDAIQAGKPVNLLLEQKYIFGRDKEISQKLSRYNIHITRDENAADVMAVLSPLAMHRSPHYIRKGIPLITVDHLHEVMLEDEQYPLRRNTDAMVNRALLRSLISRNTDDCLNALLRIEQEGANRIILSGLAAVWRSHSDRTIRKIAGELYQRFGSFDFRIWANAHNATFFDTPVYRNKFLDRMSGHPAVDKIIFMLTAVSINGYIFEKGTVLPSRHNEVRRKMPPRIYVPSLDMYYSDLEDVPEEADIFTTVERWSFDHCNVNWEKVLGRIAALPFITELHVEGVGRDYYQALQRYGGSSIELLSKGRVTVQ